MVVHDDSLVIAARFQGPPTSGNGGYVCGALGQRLGGTVEVRLHRPPPLDRPLLIVCDGAVLHLRDGDSRLATARPARLRMDIPRPPTWAEAAAAGMSPAATAHHAAHPFPGCFVCGPGRASGEGLRLFAGPVRPNLWATVWTPTAAVADAAGRVAPAIVWAALDCPTYMPFLAQERVMLLGTMTARRLDDVHAGRRYLLMTWPMRAEGRKFVAGGALFDDTDELVAACEAVWIAL